MTKPTQRNAQGRFLVGNPGGPGRPKRQTEEGYLAVLMEECSLEQWRGVVKRAVADAADGDEKARQWLASYLVGSPQAKAPTTTTVVIQQLLGSDPALERAADQLAIPEINRARFPSMQGDDELKARVKAEAAAAILAAEP
jgi:hypothetical protein